MIYKSYILEKNIENINENIFLFYGENTGLKDDFKKRVKLINKKAQFYNFTQEEIINNENIFYNEINNISLFGENKFFFISQATDKILEIIKNVEPQTDARKIYLFSEILDKKSKLRSYFEKSKNAACIACYADNEINIKNIISSELKGFSDLSSENIKLIADNCNLDRVKLNNEIHKIITYFTNKKLEKNKLEILLNAKINDNFNLLKDEALSGNKSLTNKLLSDTIMESEKNIFYLSTINQRLNKLAAVCSLSKKNSLEEAINNIKPPIFWKDKEIIIKQAKKWNLPKIRKILNKTYNLEFKIKSSTILNKNLLIKKLLIDICAQANA